MIFVIYVFPNTICELLKYLDNGNIFRKLMVKISSAILYKIKTWTTHLKIISLCLGTDAGNSTFLNWLECTENNIASK